MFQKWNLEVYRTEEGISPFDEWIGNLRDLAGVDRINTRLARARLGNFGVWRSVGDGITELKIDFGPGYRVYIGRAGDALLILLCGGDKRTQTKDIDLAKKYWADHWRRKK